MNKTSSRLSAAAGATAPAAAVAVPPAAAPTEDAAPDTPVINAAASAIVAAAAADETPPVFAPAGDVAMPSSVEARVLRVIDGHRPDDIVVLDLAAVAVAVEDGWADPTPAAVEYARGLRG